MVINTTFHSYSICFDHVFINILNNYYDRNDRNIAEICIQMLFLIF